MTTTLASLLLGYGSLLALSVGKLVDSKEHIFILPLNHTEEDYNKFLMEHGDFNLDGDDSVGSVLFNMYGAFFYRKEDGDFCEQDDHWLNFPKDMGDVFAALEEFHCGWNLNSNIKNTEDILDLNWYHKVYCKNDYYRLKFLPHELILTYFKDSNITFSEYFNYRRLIEARGGVNDNLAYQVFEGFLNRK